MIPGLLETFQSQEDMEKAVKKYDKANIERTWGIDADTLLNDINIHEANGATPAQVVSILKRDLLQLLGKAEFVNDKNE